MSKQIQSQDEIERVKPLSDQEYRLLDICNQVIERENYRSDRSFLMANGFNPTLLYKVRTGRQKMPSKVLSVLKEKYGVNINYIYSGEGQPFIAGVGVKEGDQGSNVSFQVPAINWQSLPVVTESVTASFVEHFGQSQEVEFEEYIQIPMSNQERLPSGSVLVRVRGESMVPQIQDGALIMVTPVSASDWVYLNSGIYVIAYGSFLVVKRVIDNELRVKNILTLHSDNPLAGVNVVGMEDIRGIWKVHEVLRSPVR
jgi:repressor LexA